eukprot:gnl/Chilomastix_cuspidata/3795.p1 GENE.gnl/Chilomastix_cuspidata/3795~~gnl/Chilomastix_cuspidata/3795.p1  ORF type:complete len:1275 (-),score=337.55 gnl/Chilomastix_cuspidata/3795:877-4701(-)
MSCRMKSTSFACGVMSASCTSSTAGSMRVDVVINTLSPRARQRHASNCIADVFPPPPISEIAAPRTSSEVSPPASHIAPRLRGQVWLDLFYALSARVDRVPAARHLAPTCRLHAAYVHTQINCDSKPNMGRAAQAEFAFLFEVHSRFTFSAPYLIPADPRATVGELQETLFHTWKDLQTLPAREYALTLCPSDRSPRLSGRAPLYLAHGVLFRLFRRGECPRPIALHVVPRVPPPPPPPRAAWSPAAARTAPVSMLPLGHISHLVRLRAPEQHSSHATFSTCNPCTTMPLPSDAVEEVTTAPEEDAADVLHRAATAAAQRWIAAGTPTQFPLPPHALPTDAPRCFAVTLSFARGTQVVRKTVRALSLQTAHSLLADFLTAHVVADAASAERLAGELALHHESSAAPLLADAPLGYDAGVRRLLTTRQRVLLVATERVTADPPLLLPTRFAAAKETAQREFFADFRAATWDRACAAHALSTRRIVTPVRIHIGNAAPLPATRAHLLARFARAADASKVVTVGAAGAAPVFAFAVARLLLGQRDLCRAVATPLFPVLSDLAAAGAAAPTGTACFAYPVVFPLAYRDTPPGTVLAFSLFCGSFARLPVHSIPEGAASRPRSEKALAFAVKKSLRSLIDTAAVQAQLTPHAERKETLAQLSGDWGFVRVGTARVPLHTCAGWLMRAQCLPLAPAWDAAAPWDPPSLTIRPDTFPRSVYFERFANFTLPWPRTPLQANVFSAASVSLPSRRHTSGVSMLDRVFALDSLYAPNPLERSLLWRSRRRCVGAHGSLSRLLGVVHWGCAEAERDVAELLARWPPLPPVEAVLLLSAPDAPAAVRVFAVANLERLPDELLAVFILHFVEALRTEPCGYSALFLFLLQRALSAPNVFGEPLVWQLRSLAAVRPNAPAGAKARILLDVLRASASDAFQQKIENQFCLFDELKEIAAAVRDVPAPRRDEFLAARLSSLRTPAPLSVPSSPHRTGRRVVPERCKVMASKKMPIRVIFESADPRGAPFGVFLKIGDDLRQDQLTLQLLRVMDLLWRDAGLDLRTRAYNAVAVGASCGLIEMVPDAESIASITKWASGALGAFSEKPVDSWLRAQNRADAQYACALENFVASCAGACVFTRVLGVGDRHNDNVLLSADGVLFHIDFGHFLGNFKKKFHVKRETAPFFFTPDLAFAMGGCDSHNFARFRELCGRAFNVLRRHAAFLVDLVAAMARAGIPELGAEGNASWVRAALLPGASEAQAEAHFTDLIDQSLRTRRTQVNNMIHILVN